MRKVYIFRCGDKCRHVAKPNERVTILRWDLSGAARPSKSQKGMAASFPGSSPELFEPVPLAGVHVGVLGVSLRYWQWALLSSTSAMMRSLRLAKSIREKGRGFYLRGVLLAGRP